MRTLFLSMDAVLQPLSRKFTYVEAVQWIGHLGADLAAHEDVQVVLNRVSEEPYPIVAGEIMFAALGTRLRPMAGPAELAGPISTYLHEHQEVTDFVVLENSLSQLDGPLHEHLILCDASLGADDHALLEARDWLAGAPRARSSSLTAALRASNPPSAAERMRALLPPARPDRVVATVTAVVPEFELVRLEAAGDLTVSIGRSTPGVDWRELQIGQRLECDLEGEYATRVVKARLLPPDDSPTHPPGTEEGPAR